MSAHLSRCTLCPRLCRAACPVAVGSAREASVPTQIAGVLLDAAEGRVSRELAAEAATLCTDCGACEEHCHLHQPLPRLIREARALYVEVVPPQVPAPPVGDFDLIAVEADERPLAEALSRRLGRPVSPWRTRDQFGLAACDSSYWAEHAALLRTHTTGRTVVVADGGAALALERAGVRHVSLDAIVSGLPPATGSCVARGGPRPLACCGGGGPLHQHHPEDAARVADAWWRRAPTELVADARCRCHLRRSGHPARDWVDVLLEAH